MVCWMQKSLMSYSAYFKPSPVIHRLLESLQSRQPCPSITRHLILYSKAKRFLFTGTCAFGTRQQCHEATQSLGGVIAMSVSKSLDYLVIGTYVTDSWMHESYGRKIEKAMNYRAAGVPINIVTEECWVEAGKFL